MKSILKMALLTVGTMAACNYLAALNPTARKFLKGSVAVGLPSTTQSATGGSSWWSI